MIVQNDQRLFDRLTARFPAKFKDVRGDFGTDVFLRDISASGAKLATRERFFKNDQIAVEVKLPDGQPPLQLSGEVVWVKPEEPDFWLMGLVFPQIRFIKWQRLIKLCE